MMLSLSSLCSFLSLLLIFVCQGTWAFVGPNPLQRRQFRSLTSPQQLASDNTASLSDLLDQFEDERDVPKLEEWAFNKGIEFAEGVRLVDNGLGDWGVGCEESLPSKSPVMTIPPDLILSSSDKQVNDYKERIVQSMSTMQYYAPECLLMVRILQEVASGDKSPWKEWLKTLPLDFSTGLYLDPLERSVVERVAGPFLDQQDQQWQACQTAIQGLGLEAIDDDQLKWAFSVVFTRSWRTSAGDIATLVPLGDMFNHDSAKPNVAPNQLADGSIQLATKCDVEPGSPLYLSYGFGNFPGRFLVQFGFWDRSSEFMDANLTMPKELPVEASQMVVSTRNGAVAEDVFTVAVYQFLLQRGDEETAKKMIEDPTTYAMAYDLEGAMWLRLHALKTISETYPDMDIAPENLSESPRRYGMIARYNNGMRESWMRVIDYLELEIEDAMKQRQAEEAGD